MSHPDSTTSAEQVEFTWSDDLDQAASQELTYTSGEVRAIVAEHNDVTQQHLSTITELREQIGALSERVIALVNKNQDDLASLDNVHRARIDRLMEVAGRRADENSLCHVFEQTLIECGEPFDGFFDRVTMDITFTVTVNQDVLADRRARRHDLTYMQRADVLSTYYAEHMIRTAMRNVSGEYGYAPILDSSDYAPVNHVFPKFVDVSNVGIDVISTEAINGHEAGDSRYGNDTEERDDTEERRYRDAYGDD